MSIEISITHPSLGRANLAATADSHDDTYAVERNFEKNFKAQ